jgi:PHS family inorganic phosphate transporter-like MFS transporter
VPFVDGTFLRASTHFGAFLGLIVFGFLGDRLGRKRMYTIGLTISFASTFASCFSGNLLAGMRVLTVFAMWRVSLGIGIGICSTMIAVMTSEVSF